MGWRVTWGEVDGECFRYGGQRLPGQVDLIEI